MIEVGLPEGWVITTLGEISTKLQYGWTTKADLEKGKIKLLRTTDITSGKVDWGKVPYCTQDPEDLEKYLLKPGDIVISRAGSVGVSFLVTDADKDKGVFASYLIRFRPTEPIDRKYVYYFLKSPDYWAAIGASKSGIAVPNVNASKLADVPFPLAPVNQQKRIVVEIEKQFSRLDEAIVSVKRVKANLKRYKAAVLKAAVEGKLTEQWRKEHPSVEPAEKLLQRILAGRYKKWEEAESAKMKARNKKPKDDRWKKRYKEPAQPDVTELPLLPNGWAWVTVDQLAAAEPAAITDGPFGSNLKTEHYTSSGPRVIRLQNIGVAEFIDEKAHISEVHYVDLIKHSVEPNDIVIAALGQPAPKACLVPASVGNAIVKADCIRFRTSEPYVNPGYIMYSLNSDPTQKRTGKIIHGIGRPRLNLGEIKSIALPLPPKDEQDSIFDEIERRLSLMREIDRQVEIMLERSQRLRQSILKNAFSGQLVVQDAKGDFISGPAFCSNGSSDA